MSFSWTTKWIDFNSTITGGETGASPGTPASGDRIYAVITQAFSTGVFTPPTGWTQIGTTQFAASGTAVGFFELTSPRGSSAPSYVWTSADAPYWSLQIVGMSGRGTGAATFKTVTPGTGVGATTPQTVNISGGTAAAGDDLICLIGLDDNTSDVICDNFTGSPGTGIDRGFSTFAYAHTSISTLDNISAGATGTMTINLHLATGSDWINGYAAALIAVPASGSPAVTIPTYSSYITL